MPLLITEMTLDTAKLLSLVDAGASGDEDTRPEIVLFKRRTKAMDKEQILKLMKSIGVDLEKMGVSEVVTALDELGLKPEQRDGVLKLMEAMMGGGEEKPAAPEKAEDEAPPPAPPAEGEAEKMEDEEMKKRADAIAKLEKRHAEEKAELAKRVKDLEDQAQLVKLEKRAGELEFLPIEKGALISLLKRIGDDEAGQEMLTKLAKMAEASPLLKVAGVEGEGEQSAKLDLEKRIKKLMDADPSINEAAAKAAVFKNNPSLYKRLREEEAAQ